MCRDWVLPGEVGESLVGLCHLLGVVALLDRGAFVVVGGHELDSETLVHRLAFSAAGGVDDPSEGKVLLALWANFAGNLIVGSSNAARANLDCRRDILDGGLEDLGWILYAHLFLDDVESTVDDLAGSLLLSVEHNRVDELLEALRSELDVRTRDITFFDWASHSS